MIGSPIVGVDRVLANDCLVGAFTRTVLPPDFNPDKTSTAVLSPGDLDEAVQTAVEVGDDTGDQDEFGTPFEKISAFRLGVLGDLGACQDRFGL